MTPDVNILVAASRDDHPHHAVAIHWLKQALAEAGNGKRMAVLPMVAAGFVRLATHPKLFVEPTPLEDAMKFLSAVIHAPGVEMPELGQEWSMFEALCAQHQLTGNWIPDAWIAAAVRCHHLHLFTFDRDFRKLLKPSMVTVLKGSSPVGEQAS